MIPFIGILENVNVLEKRHISGCQRQEEVEGVDYKGKRGV